ncbi:DUF7010 family protein [Spirosoma endbachense]|uniref:Uncharacterized protein n=1 Tax=Spirosoma endbachense TaxID=2666025 RepID=A0A6P1VVJ4_9BACT|nr:hypothetical protein [Spirosoma endbachense]QHV95396.1 hypothetical protein GJR95_10415 [Spirosoma endbachense]
MDFDQALTNQKRNYFVDANAGLSLPVAGTIYWAILGIAGFYLKPGYWMLLAFCTSGLLFPLGLALQKPFKSNLMVKTPLSSLIPYALFSMMLSWAITVPASSLDKSFAPLCLAIGMSIHWPIIGWIYDSKVCQLHALIRALLVVACWYLLPNDRFTILPLVVSGVYALTVLGLKWEVTKVREQRVLRSESTLVNA